MNEALVRLVAGRFESFTAPFLNEPGDTFAYALKVDHTKRVHDLAQAIATAEGFPEHLLLAARLAALMHDVGRFPQYRRFRTFRDKDSANHAALSVQHLLREKMLADVPAPTRRLVLGAVYLHNMRSLPSLPSPELLTVARAIRDSDKLDIYQVMIEHFAQKEQLHPEVALDVKDEPLAYSENVLDDLLRGEPGNYQKIVYVNDFKLMTIGWLYDLNYQASCRMLAERGYLDTLFDSMPRHEPLLALRRQITADLARRLEGA